MPKMWCLMRSESKNRKTGELNGPTLWCDAATQFPGSCKHNTPKSFLAGLLSIPSPPACIDTRGCPNPGAGLCIWPCWTSPDSHGPNSWARPDPSGWHLSNSAWHHLRTYWEYTRSHHLCHLIRPNTHQQAQILQRNTVVTALFFKAQDDAVPKPAVVPVSHSHSRHPEPETYGVTRAPPRTSSFQHCKPCRPFWKHTAAPGDSRKGRCPHISSPGELTAHGALLRRGRWPTEGPCGQPQHSSPSPQLKGRQSPLSRVVPVS